MKAFSFSRKKETTSLSLSSEDNDSDLDFATSWPTAREEKKTSSDDNNDDDHHAPRSSASTDESDDDGEDDDGSKSTTSNVYYNNDKEEEEADHRKQQRRREDKESEERQQRHKKAPSGEGALPENRPPNRSLTILEDLQSFRIPGTEDLSVSERDLLVKRSRDNNPHEDNTKEPSRSGRQPRVLGRKYSVRESSTNNKEGSNGGVCDVEDDDDDQGEPPPVKRTSTPDLRSLLRGGKSQSQPELNEEQQQRRKGRPRRRSSLQNLDKSSNMSKSVRFQMENDQIKYAGDQSFSTMETNQDQRTQEEQSPQNGEHHDETNNNFDERRHSDERDHGQNSQRPKQALTKGKPVPLSSSIHTDSTMTSSTMTPIVPASSSRSESRSSRGDHKKHRKHRSKDNNGLGTSSDHSIDHRRRNNKRVDLRKNHSLTDLGDDDDDENDGTDDKKTGRDAKSIATMSIDETVGDVSIHSSKRGAPSKNSHNPKLLVRDDQDGPSQDSADSFAMEADALEEGSEPRKSHKKSNSKESSSRNESHDSKSKPQKDKKEGPRDRRKLLRKNSSLSDLEAMAKRRGRRKSDGQALKDKKRERNEKEREKRIKMHQSLSRLDVSDSDNDTDNDDDNNNDEIEPLSPLDIDIDIDEKHARKSSSREKSNNNNPSTEKELGKESSNAKEPKRSSSRKHVSKSEHRMSTRKESNDGTIPNSDSASKEERGPQRGVLRRNSSLSDLEDMVKSRRQTERKKMSSSTKEKSLRRLQMHMSFVSPELPSHLSNNRINDNTRNDMRDKNDTSMTTPTKNPQAQSADVSSLAAHKQDSFTLGSSKSAHVPRPTIAVAMGSKSAREVTSEDKAKSSRKRVSHFDRLKMHQSLSLLRTDNDDIGKLDLYTTNRNKDLVDSNHSPERRRPSFTKSSSLSDLGKAAERAVAKRSSKRPPRSNARQRGQDHPSVGSGSSFPTNASKESAGGAPTKSHRKSSRRTKESNSNDSNSNLDLPSCHNSEKQKDRGKTSRTSRAKDTDTTTDTSTSVEQKTENQKQGRDSSPQRPPSPNRRGLLRKNSSLNDLEVMATEVVRRKDEEKQIEEQDAMMHKSLGHLTVDIEIDRGPSRKEARGRSKSTKIDNDNPSPKEAKRGRDKNERHRGSGRSRSRRGESLRLKEDKAAKENSKGTDDKGGEEQTEQVSKPTRSRSKSQKRQSEHKKGSERARSRSRSKSQKRRSGDKRASTRARSRSKHRKPDDGEVGKEAVDESANPPHEPVPRHVFVENIELATQDAAGGASGDQQDGEGSLSSLEGPSVILDRRREERRKEKEKEKEERRVAKKEKKEKEKAAASEKSKSDLRAKSYARLNQSMGNLLVESTSNAKKESPVRSPSQRLRSKSFHGGRTKKLQWRDDSIEPDFPEVPISITLSPGQLENGNAGKSPQDSIKKRWQLDDSRGAVQENYGSFRSLDISHEGKDERLNGSTGTLDIAQLQKSPAYRNFKSSVADATKNGASSVGDGSFSVNDGSSAGGQSGKWKDRLSTHALLANFSADVPRPVIHRAKSAGGANAGGAKLIQKSSRQLILELTEQKRRQDPNEQFWGVLQDAFKPAEDSP